MSGAMNRHCIPGLGNYVHSPDGELLWVENPGIIKTMHTGFSAQNVALCQRPGADTEETRTLFSVERFV